MNRIRDIARWLHKVIGLFTALVMTIVCLTALPLAVRDELTLASEPWRMVDNPAKAKAEAPASLLVQEAARATGWGKPSALTMGPVGRAAQADYWQQEVTVHMDPHTARVLHVQRGRTGTQRFLSWCMAGHKYLWLPHQIGRQVVGWSALLLMLVLLTGLVLWLPRRWNRTLLRNGLTLRAPWTMKRLTWQLHNVMGFWFFLPLLSACLTGMVFALPWFSRGVYSLASGGRVMEDYTLPPSQSDSALPMASVDALFEKVKGDSPDAQQLYLVLPADSLQSYRVSVVHRMGSYLRQDNLFFDQRTLAELPATSPWGGRWRDGTPADRLIHATLDIHEGRILSWPGRLLMFLASLFGATLPLTGFVLWLRRGRKPAIPVSRGSR